MYTTQRIRPPLNLEPKDVDSWDWDEVLLEPTAYINDEHNHTSARCKLPDKKELQVTFWLAPPPRVSSFCVAYANRKRTEFDRLPHVVAAEANLVLISMEHRTQLDVSDSRTRLAYYVYRAVAGQSPKLTRLPHPDSSVFLRCSSLYYFRHDEVGILRYRPNIDDDYDAYKIATICPRVRGGPNQYDLYTYDSEAGAWARKDTAFSEPTMIPRHRCNKIITIGGTMGWVDLWRGIILCDLHPCEEDAKASLRYIRLPQFDHPENQLELCRGSSSFFRDIAVVQDRIKFFALRLHAGQGSRIPDGWTAATWSIAVGDLNWRNDCVLHSSDIKDVAIDFQGLVVGHPKLSLHDDNIVYLMTKVDRLGSASRMITVDMKKKEVHQVAEFATLRGGGMELSYTHSAISKYLRPPPPPGSMRNIKRPGMPLLASSCKKLQGDPLMSMQHSRDRTLQHSGYHGGQPMEGACDDSKKLPAILSMYDSVAGDDGDKMDTE